MIWQKDLERKLEETKDKEKLWILIEDGISNLTKYGNDGSFKLNKNLFNRIFEALNESFVNSNWSCCNSCLRFIWTLIENNHIKYNEIREKHASILLEVYYAIISITKKNMIVEIEFVTILRNITGFFMSWIDEYFLLNDKLEFNDTENNYLNQQIPIFMKDKIMLEKYIFSLFDLFTIAEPRRSNCNGVLEYLFIGHSLILTSRYAAETYTMIQQTNIIQKLNIKLDPKKLVECVNRFLYCPDFELQLILGELVWRVLKKMEFGIGASQKKMLQDEYIEFIESFRSSWPEGLIQLKYINGENFDYSFRGLLTPWNKTCNCNGMNIWSLSGVQINIANMDLKLTTDIDICAFSITFHSDIDEDDYNKMKNGIINCINTNYCNEKELKPHVSSAEIPYWTIKSVFYNEIENELNINIVLSELLEIRQCWTGLFATYIENLEKKKNEKDELLKIYIYIDEDQANHVMGLFRASRIEKIYGMREDETPSRKVSIADSRTVSITRTNLDNEQLNIIESVEPGALNIENIKMSIATTKDFQGDSEINIKRVEILKDEDKVKRVSFVSTKECRQEEIELKTKSKITRLNNKKDEKQTIDNEHKKTEKSSHKNKADIIIIGLLNEQKKLTQEMDKKSFVNKDNSIIDDNKKIAKLKSKTKINHDEVFEKVLSDDNNLKDNVNAENDDIKEISKLNKTKETDNKQNYKKSNKKINKAEIKTNQNNVMNSKITNVPVNDVESNKKSKIERKNVNNSKVNKKEIDNNELNEGSKSDINKLNDHINNVKLPKEEAISEGETKEKDVNIINLNDINNVNEIKNKCDNKKINKNKCSDDNLIKDKIFGNKHQDTKSEINKEKYHNNEVINKVNIDEDKNNSSEMNNDSDHKLNILATINENKNNMKENTNNDDNESKLNSEKNQLNDTKKEISNYELKTREESENSNDLKNNMIDQSKTDMPNTTLSKPNLRVSGLKRGRIQKENHGEINQIYNGKVVNIHKHIKDGKINVNDNIENSCSVNIQNMVNINKSISRRKKGETESTKMVEENTKLVTPLKINNKVSEFENNSKNINEFDQINKEDNNVITETNSLNQTTCPTRMDNANHDEKTMDKHDIEKNNNKTVTIVPDEIAVVDDNYPILDEYNQTNGLLSKKLKYSSDTRSEKLLNKWYSELNIENEVNLKYNNIITPEIIKVKKKNKKKIKSKAKINEKTLKINDIDSDFETPNININKKKVISDNKLDNEFQSELDNMNDDNMTYSMDKNIIDVEMEFKDKYILNSIEKLSIENINISYSPENFDDNITLTNFSLITKLELEKETKNGLLPNELKISDIKLEEKKHIDHIINELEDSSKKLSIECHKNIENYFMKVKNYIENIWNDKLNKFREKRRELNIKVDKNRINIENEYISLNSKYIKHLEEVYIEINKEKNQLKEMNNCNDSNYDDMFTSVRKELDKERKLIDKNIKNLLEKKEIEKNKYYNNSKSSKLNLQQILKKMITTD